MTELTTVHVTDGFPPKPTWECRLFGGDQMGIVWQVAKPPCWFWRWMQFLILGNRWERIKP
jgi:hypothetical protein